MARLSRSLTTWLFSAVSFMAWRLALSSFSHRSTAGLSGWSSATWVSSSSGTPGRADFRSRAISSA